MRLFLRLVYVVWLDTLVPAMHQRLLKQHAGCGSCTASFHPVRMDSCGGLHVHSTLQTENLCGPTTSQITHARPTGGLAGPGLAPAFPFPFAAALAVTAS